MANKRPGTDWSRVSFPPSTPAVNELRHVYDDKYVADEGCFDFGHKGASGSNGRKIQPPELGPIHRKGTEIFQTIVISEIKIGGQTGRETPKRRRVNLSLSDIHAMIIADGDKKHRKKPPHGLTMDQVHEIFQTLSQRLVAVENNTRAVTKRAEAARARHLPRGKKTGVVANPVKTTKTVLA